MVGKVTNPKVTLTLDDSQFKRGAESAALSWDQMSLAQKRTAQAMQRQGAMMAAAQREDASRTATMAAAAEAAEKRRQTAMVTTGKVAMTAGAALVVGLGLSARAAVNWEADFARVRKTVAGSDQEMGALESQLRALTLVLPASHDEIASVAEAAGQLGVQRENIAGFTKIMIELGTTTTMTATDAATALAQLMNIMQTAPDKVSNLGATVLALGNAGAATEGVIVDMAQRIAGAAKTVGMSEADVLGLAGAISSVGVDAEAGGSAVSRVIINIAQSVAAGNDKMKAWARTAGMSAQDFTAAWKGDPARALDAVVTGLGQLQKAGGDVFAVLADVDATNIRTTMTMLNAASAGDLMTKQLDLASQAWRDNSALADAAAKRYGTAAAKTTIAKNAIADAGITIGNQFLPFVGKSATGVADLAKWIGQLPAPVLGAATVLGTLAATTLLAGGAAMTGVVKWRQLRKELDLLSTSGSKIKSSLAIGGKALTAATLLLTAPAAAPTGVSARSNEMVDNIRKLAAGGTAVDTIFSGIGQGNWLSGARRDFKDLVEQASDTSVWAGLDSWLGKVGDGLGGIVGADIRQNFTKQEDALKAYGDVLGQLADGDLPTATKAFHQLYNEAGGTDASGIKLLNLMPGYKDALVAIANKAGMATDDQTLLKIAIDETAVSQKNASGTTEGLTAHYNAAAGAVQQLTDVQKQYLDEVASSDAAMISLSDAYSGSVSDAQAAAQAKADAYNKEAQAREDASKKRGISLSVEKKQWQDFYDGKTVTIAAYLGKLGQQAAEQNQWETDLLTLAGKGVNQETVDMLRGQGKDLAPLVHQFATQGTADQLGQLQRLAGEGGASATQQFADQLISGSPVLAAAGAQLGDAAVNALVAKLVSGKATLQQLVDEYGLIVSGMPKGGPFGTTTPSYWAPQGFGAGGFGGSFADTIPTPQPGPSPVPPGGSRTSVQVVPVPIATKVDQSTNYYGPTTFTDPAAASSRGAAARANTAGRRGGAMKVS